MGAQARRRVTRKGRLPLTAFWRGTIRETKAAAKELGLVVPPTRWRVWTTMWWGDESIQGWTYARGRCTVIDIVPPLDGNPAEIVVHEMAHAIVAPILRNDAVSHNGPWAAVYAPLYRAVVDGS